MMELGPATEHDMVLAFLRAEVDSPRFGHIVCDCLRMLRSDRGLIDHGDLADARQNAIRKEVLGGVRGYAKDAYLFRGFPTKVTWRHVRLDWHDFQTMRYANYSDWIEYSDGTRLVSIGARNANAKPTICDGAKAIARAIEQGVHFPEIIAVEPENGSLILVEGHTRATAYVLSNSTGVDAIVGSSTGLDRWQFY